MNQKNKPKYLYRGVVFDYNQLENFAFSGDLSVPYEPFTNAQRAKYIT